jgi:hypothetical protein
VAVIMPVAMGMGVFVGMFMAGAMGMIVRHTTTPNTNPRRGIGS